MGCADAETVPEIRNLDITEKVPKRCALNEETLGEMEERPKSWVALAVLQVMGEERLVGEKLQVALDFHLLVSNQAAAHLHLLFDNTYRTPWLAAKLLSKGQGPGSKCSSSSCEAPSDHKACKLNLL